MRQKGWSPVILVILTVAMSLEQLPCAGLGSALWLPLPEPSYHPTAFKLLDSLCHQDFSRASHPGTVYVDNTPRLHIVKKV